MSSESLKKSLSDATSEKSLFVFSSRAFSTASLNSSNGFSLCSLVENPLCKASIFEFAYYFDLPWLQGAGESAVNSLSSGLPFSFLPQIFLADG